MLGAPRLAVGKSPNGNRMDQGQNRHASRSCVALETHPPQAVYTVSVGHPAWARLSVLGRCVRIKVSPKLGGCSCPVRNMASERFR